MVYVGGVHHFIGAILGAVAITWLQVSLSDYTTAWMLYLGLFFMAIVAFLPGGLAQLVQMHAAALRSHALGGILRSYLLALPFALAALVGAATLIEIVYRRSTEPEAGALMRLFWIPMDTSRPWPWVLAAGVLLLGVLALLRTWPRVAAAWEPVGGQVRAHA
jgi:branched-chain amino acid transport system permease protein